MIVVQASQGQWLDIRRCQIDSLDVVKDMFVGENEEMIDIQA